MHIVSEEQHGWHYRSKIRFDDLMGEFVARQAGSSEEVKHGKEAGTEASRGQRFLDVGSEQCQVTAAS